MNGLGRRNFLKVGGVATLTATAGCLGVLDDGDGDGGGDVPEYEQYLATGDDEVFFAYADFEGLEEIEDQSDGDGGGGEGDFGDLDEPLLAAPMAGIFLLAFGAGFTLASGGLGGLFGDQEESDLESRADQVLVVNEVTVVAGDLDTDEIDGRLTSEQESDFFAVQYEVDEEVDGYTFYAPPEDAEAPVFAVGENELVAASERSGVKSVIDAIGGDGRATGEFDEFEWLLEAAGDGLIALGGYGPDGFEEPDAGSEESGQEQPNPDEALSELDGANGVVSSLGFSDEQADATLAASFDDLDEDQRGTIESDLESDRVDVSVEFDGGRVTANATYSEDVLDETTENQE